MGRSPGLIGMLILGINGSPRGERGATMRLVRAVLEGARERGAETDAVNLVDHDLRFRNACSTCFTDGECAYPDDFPAVYARIRAADGLVLGSPVYIDLVSGQMKLLIDRMADGIQCQSLAGKYGCAVATSGDHAEDAVATYLNHFLKMLGATPVGELAVAAGEDGAAIGAAEGRAVELGRTLADAVATERPYPEIDEFHRRYREKFADVIDGPRPARPPDYDSWVDRTWRW